MSVDTAAVLATVSMLARYHSAPNRDALARGAAIGESEDYHVSGYRCPWGTDQTFHYTR